jgi:hypothetical protein
MEKLDKDYGGLLRQLRSKKTKMKKEINILIRKTMY